MCGHAVIALGRYAIDYNLVKPVSPETLVKIQCPCGLVTARVEYENNVSGSVKLESVPAFAFSVNQTISVEGYGEVRYDIGYGGTFYALADVGQFGLDLTRSPIHELIRAADSLSTAVKSSVVLSHPEFEDVAFLYGSILTDGRDDKEESANVCVFADCQVGGEGLVVQDVNRWGEGLVVQDVDGWGEGLVVQDVNGWGEGLVVQDVNGWGEGLVVQYVNGWGEGLVVQDVDGWEWRDCCIRC